MPTVVFSNSSAPSVDITQEQNSFDTVILVPQNLYIPEDSLDFSVVGDDASIKSIFYPDYELLEGHDVFVGTVGIKAILEAKSEKDFKIQVSYKSCTKQHLCSDIKTYEKTFKIIQSKKETKPEIDKILSEQDSIARLIKNSSFILTIATFFGFGLLLAFTPCMLPVIPILSAVIIAKEKGMNPKKGFMLSLVYVISMSVVYALAGVAAASLGSNIQAFFQQPWIIILVSSIFFILSLAMFGTFSIEMPKRIQTLLSIKSDSRGGRSYYGVVFLGVLSALIVGPCVAPPLAGALIYIGQTGNELVGGLSLFFMSFGMGVPLLLLGAGAGKFIPKPGPWMDDVKLFFGFSLIAFSIWILSRILEAEMILFLWGLLLVAIAVFMNPFEDINSIDISRMYQLKKLFSIVCLIIGVIFIVGAVGGAKSIKRPLEPFIYKDTPSSSSGVVFKTIYSQDLDDTVMNSSKPVMALFSADWCDNCKELDANVFSKNDVAKELKEFDIYKIDITKNSDIDIELLKKYSLFGPPGVIFFDNKKKELKSYRLSGNKEKEVFIQHIQKIKKIL